MYKTAFILALTCVCAPLLCAQSRAADATVAADGSGAYRTVQEAINDAPSTADGNHRWVIFVKAGTYREVVNVPREKRLISIIGEDPLRTVITYNLAEWPTRLQEWMKSHGWLDGQGKKN